MKKYFLTITLSLFMLQACFVSQTAEAKSYKMIGKAKTEFSTTKKIPNKLYVNVESQEIKGANSVVANDVVIELSVFSVNNATRGKRNASVDALLSGYSYDGNDFTDTSEKNIQVKIKNYSKTDFVGLGESAATTVVSHVFNIPFLSQGVAAVKGAISPVEGHSRLSSAGISAYKSTPFSYIDKGEEMNVKTGDKLTLIFKINEADCEDASNKELTDQPSDAQNENQQDANSTEITQPVQK